MFQPIKLCVTALIILGIALRFYHLDHKVYWLDETFTALRVSGYSATELVDLLPKNQVITIAEFQQYYHPSPERTFNQVSQALASNAEHTPLYFILVRFWRAWFGSSIAATRSLSALISLFAFPAIYWLCRELFPSPKTAWLAMGLLAVSPFQILYAQEARQYSLLAVITLAASAALLRAIRLHSTEGKLWHWAIYAGSLTVGLYTHLLFGLVLFAHGIYLLWLDRFRLTQLFQSYFLASTAGMIGFLPWVWVIIANLNKVKESGAWQGEAQKPSLAFYVKSWLGNTARQFVDFGLSSETGGDIRWFIPILLGLVFLVAYALYIADRTTDRRVFLFLITLGVIPWLILAIPDVLFGSTRSNIQRYIIPTFLAMQVAVAHLLVTEMSSGRSLRATLWKGITILLFSLGIISCVLSAQAQVWWNKRADAHSLEVSALVNQTENPLLMTKVHRGMRLGVLSYQLQPTVRVLLIGDTLPEIPQGNEAIFIYDPSPMLIAELEKKYRSKLQPAIESKNPRTGLSWLWRVNP